MRTVDAVSGKDGEFIRAGNCDPLLLFVKGR